MEIPVSVAAHRQFASKDQSYLNPYTLGRSLLTDPEPRAEVALIRSKAEIEAERLRNRIEMLKRKPGQSELRNALSEAISEKLAPPKPMKKKLPPVIAPRVVPKRDRFSVAKYLDEQQLKSDPERELIREQWRNKASMIELRVLALTPEGFPGSLPDESVFI